MWKNGLADKIACEFSLSFKIQTSHFENLGNRLINSPRKQSLLTGAVTGLVCEAADSKHLVGLLNRVYHWSVSLWLHNRARIRAPLLIPLIFIVFTARNRRLRERNNVFSHVCSSIQEIIVRWWIAPTPPSAWERVQLETWPVPRPYLVPFSHAVLVNVWLAL